MNLSELIEIRNYINLMINNGFSRIDKNKIRSINELTGLIDQKIINYLLTPEFKSSLNEDHNQDLVLEELKDIKTLLKSKQSNEISDATKISDKTKYMLDTLDKANEAVQNIEPKFFDVFENSVPETVEEIKEKVVEVVKTDPLKKIKKNTFKRAT